MPVPENTWNDWFECAMLQRAGPQVQQTPTAPVHNDAYMEHRAMALQSQYTPIRTPAKQEVSENLWRSIGDLAAALVAKAEAQK